MKLKHLGSTVTDTVAARDFFGEGFWTRGHWQEQCNNDTPSRRII
jgi:hypothetical protein